MVIREKDIRGLLKKLEASQVNPILFRRKGLGTFTEMSRGVKVSYGVVVDFDRRYIGMAREEQADIVRTEASGEFGFYRTSEGERMEGGRDLFLSLGDALRSHTALRESGAERLPSLDILSSRSPHVQEALARQAFRRRGN